MTRYAIDMQRTALHATWTAGMADTSLPVAAVPTGAPDDEVSALAAAMTGLSAALWLCYTHTAPPQDTDEVNTVAWRRQETRASFGIVTSAVRKPNLPVDDMLIVSYNPVEEHAHRVGRALHAIDSDALTDAVVGDIELELAAVEQAEQGNLTGRAQQAVTLTRQQASPVQVAAADQLLRASPQP